MLIVNSIKSHHAPNIFNFSSLQRKAKQTNWTHDLNVINAREVNKIIEASKFLDLDNLSNKVNYYVAKSRFKGQQDEKSLEEQIVELRESIQKLQEKLDKKITLDQIVDVVKKVTPSTVMIQAGRATGSGVIIKDNVGRRYILTNAHVVESAMSDYTFGLNGGFFSVKLYNGSDNKLSFEFSAGLFISRNGQPAISPKGVNDLALLEIPSDVLLPQNVGIELRDITSEPLQVGEPVIAVGAPYGAKDSVTFGITSHTDRNADINENQHIQTDADIGPGNSGGGLFDMKGRLVGINTWGVGNIGGSIRVDNVKKVLEAWGIPVMSEKERMVTRTYRVAA